MDAIGIVLIAIGVVVAALAVSAGWWLDRRSQRKTSERWMTRWVIRNRVLNDLWRKMNGPPRLQDRRSAEDRER